MTRPTQDPNHLEGLTRREADQQGAGGVGEWGSGAQDVEWGGGGTGLGLGLESTSISRLPTCACGDLKASS
jgi:hypothetical protein